MSSTIDPSYLTEPSEEELSHEIRDFSPSMTLYWGGDDPKGLTFEFAGREFWIPPDLGGKLSPHPRQKQTDERGRILGPLMVQADGCLKVRNQYGYLQDDLTRKFTGSHGLLKGQEVDAIVKFAATNYATSGVVWLRGDESDEKRKKAARALYRNHYKAAAQMAVDARAAFVENFQRHPNNKNKPIPAPTPTQRRAQMYLDKWAEHEHGAYEFVCPHGCSDFEQFEDFARHMKVNHNVIVPAPGESAEVEPGADVPKAARGKGKK